LDTSVETRHIAQFLKPFEGDYEIKWVDDFNCLIIFYQYNNLRAAKYILNGQFKVKEYDDHASPELDNTTNPFHHANSSSSHTNTNQQHQAKPMPKLNPTIQTWHSDQNFFSALSQ